MKTSCYIASFTMLSSTFTRATFLGTDHVFIRGAPLVGGTNGMYFDHDNNLIVAQVYGRAISKMNPETGEILEQLGFDDQVAFADDVTVDENGTLYWTDSFYYETVFMRSGEMSEPLLPPGSVPFANPVTIAGQRLFYAQCWNPEEANGVYQVDLETKEVTTVIDSVFGCASNAMDFHDEALYTPRPYEQRIVKIDLTDGSISNATTAWGGAPQALKFNSQGSLFATNSGNGQVARIDLTKADTDNNREVVAEFPPGWIDNLAFDKDDRLFVSSTSDGTVVEVLSSGETRIVSPPEGFPTTMGLALLNDLLFTVHPGALFAFDTETGERKLTVRSVPGGAGSLHEPTSLSTWDDELVLMSFVSGKLDIYDPFTETISTSAFFDGPNDAHPFQGGLLVTGASTGNVVWASGEELGDREVIFTTSGAAFLGGNESHVYMTDLINNTVYQLIADNDVLDPPVVVATGFDAPEGIALYENKLLVVNSGSNSLHEVDLATGETSVIATDLGFFPGIDGLAIGFANDVVVDGTGAIYVNGDKANAIYKFAEDTEDTSSATWVMRHGLLHLLTMTSLILILTC